MAFQGALKCVFSFEKSSSAEILVTEKYQELEIKASYGSITVLLEIVLEKIFVSRWTKLIKNSLVVRTIAYGKESCMPGLVVPDSFQEMLVSYMSGKCPGYLEFLEEMVTFSIVFFSSGKGSLEWNIFEKHKKF